MAQGGLIYKICRKSEYDAARREGVFTGSVDDKRDGFIHFSTYAQVRGTLEKHFSGETDLHLLAINSDHLTPDLKWEISRGGEKFPHLYKELDMSLVDEDVKISWDGTQHQLPEGDGA